MLSIFLMLAPAAADLVLRHTGRNTSDPFLKISLLRDGKSVQSFKTKVIKKTLNPVWEEPFSCRLLGSVERTDLLLGMRSRR